MGTKRIIEKLDLLNAELDDLQKQGQKELQQTANVITDLFALFNEVQVEVVQIPESMKTLADHGWYADSDFDIFEINRVASLLKDGRINDADLVMVNRFTELHSAISKKLISDFPQRAQVLKAALRAHEHGDYYLSIPVFFTQVEGICFELTGKPFFNVKGSGKTATAKWVANLKIEAVYGMMLRPLEFVGVARKVTSKSRKTPIGVNRHDVLHGISCDYGSNPISSFKTLSLLNYMGIEVKKVKDAHSKRISSGQ